MVSDPTSASSGKCDKRSVSSTPSTDFGPLSPLANPTATRETLEAFGLATKKKLGQNFLVNDAIIRKIVDLAELGPDDYVLEVGPGIGTLTIAMLKSAGRVLSIEQDADLPVVLAQTTRPWADRFALINMDGLDVSECDLADAGGEMRPNKFVANLPYAVAATLILGYFERFPFLESATVMVQREVADRIAAEAGSKTYGAYTVKLGMYAKVTGRFLVGPSNFFPPPHVDSSVIRLERVAVCDDDGAPLSRAEIGDVCMMADAAFASRRKTIANSFKTYFSGRGLESPLAQQDISRLLASCDIDPRRRGETLDQSDFIRLAKAFRRDFVGNSAG